MWFKMEISSLVVAMACPAVVGLVGRVRNIRRDKLRCRRFLNAVHASSGQDLTRRRRALILRATDDSGLPHSWRMKAIGRDLRAEGR